MKGPRRVLRVSRSLVPQWDPAGGTKRFAVSATAGSRYETCVKIVLLLALALAQRASFIHVHLLYAHFLSGDVRIISKPKLAFVPNVVGSCSPIGLTVFAASPSEQQSLAHGLVHAVWIRQRGLRRSHQLFVSRTSPHKGKPIMKQRLSHWVVEPVALGRWHCLKWTDTFTSQWELV